MAEVQQKTEDNKVGALTSRDLQSLEGSFFDNSPTRGFEDFLVTLPTDANFPFEIQHQLTPSLPTGIRWEVIGSMYPTILYHDPNDEWREGYVILRATAAGGGQIRVRLTVDDGDDTPMLEPDQSATGIGIPSGGYGGIYYGGLYFRRGYQKQSSDSLFFKYVEGAASNGLYVANTPVPRDNTAVLQANLQLTATGRAAGAAGYAAQVALTGKSTESYLTFSIANTTKANILSLESTKLFPNSSMDLGTSVQRFGTTYLDGTLDIAATRPRLKLGYTGNDVTSSVQMSGTDDLVFSYNAYYDGTSWLLDNTAYEGSLFNYTRTAGWKFYTTPSGSGARTWTERFKIDTSGILYEEGRTVGMGRWTTYTPTWTASGSSPSLGNGTLTGRYTIIGKTVHCRINLQMGSTTTFGTGTYTWSLPQTAFETGPRGIAEAYDNSAATRYPGILHLGSTTTCQVQQDFGQFWGATSMSFTWADNDSIALYFSYEMA